MVTKCCDGSIDNKYQLIVYCIFDFHSQATVNIDDKIKGINCSQPYLLVLEGDEHFNYTLICENEVFFTDPRPYRWLVLYYRYVLHL